MSVLSTPSPWPEQFAAGLLGGVDPTDADETPTNDLLLGMAEIDRGRAALAYAEYRSAAVLYDRYVAAKLVEPSPSGFVTDGYADCAARIARARGVGQRAAEKLLGEAVSLRDRLPEVFDCLRDGIIAPWQAQLTVTRTELVEESAAAPLVDAEIAHLLRTRKGVWSRARMRDMIDRVVYRHDPDAVRQRRKDALDARGVWTAVLEDGTGEITAVGAAEDVRIAAARVAGLAKAVCRNDPRTVQQRRSDAMFALLSGTGFECDCGRAECDADIPDPSTITAPPSTAIMVHVVCDEATLAGTADNPAFVEGHGLISGEHVRDIAQRPDAVVKPVIGPQAVANPDGSFTLPAHQPSDPYRPSAALDTFLRIRDGYCADPGCVTSAWQGDGDHVAEFDHDHPEQGGQTTAEGMNIKCRPGHLLKTFGEWVDDQWRDSAGRLRTEYITPEGLVLPGEAETNEDVFPGLRRIRFVAPAQGPPVGNAHNGIDNTRPRRGRVADKHARRRAERNRNRRARDARDLAAGPPPF
ncbi:DUF222 domain-containing protein [Gordonia sp. ABSL49_1]|uniref:DUF222 domain-containing protein n=1 Tax=Gordonia sp. ABSL49_1 TaxID=2920941 RepID=UPI001F0E6332|nr:DUF222 domain-containing protein [Gordonia sp. ABSL49_1]MCH5641211.1 13E12 repeat family protein [Gordonia sp. ABSL49_1]